MSNLATIDVSTLSVEQLEQFKTIDVMAVIANAELERRALVAKAEAERRELVATFKAEGATTPSGVHFTYVQALRYVQSTLHFKGDLVPAQVLADVEFLRNAVFVVLGEEKPKHKWNAIKKLIDEATTATK